MKNKVKELRTQSKMHQQQLADLVHVSSCTVISIEKEQQRDDKRVVASNMLVIFLLGYAVK